MKDEAKDALVSFATLVLVGAAAVAAVAVVVLAAWWLGTMFPKTMHALMQVLYAAGAVGAVIIVLGAIGAVLVILKFTFYDDWRK